MQTAGYDIQINQKLDAARAMLAALKQAVQCVEYCRRAHKDAQSGEGFPVEMFWKQIIAQAEAAGIKAKA